MARFINPVPYALDNNGDPVVGAKLYFYETGSVILKSVYSDSDFATATTNPQVAEAGGRFTGDIFLDGIYNVVLTDANDVVIWTKDPVGDIVEGQFELWISSNTYNIPEIVLGSDDEYYRSITDGNQGNDPVSSPINWEQLQIGRVWNTNVTYAVTDSAYGSDGFLYVSKTATNLGNDPLTSFDDWERDRLLTPDTLSNISFTAAVSTKAFTFALKTENGIDPTSTDPVRISFRSSTLTTGDYAERKVVAATSVVLPSGGTLGFIANEAGYIYNYAIDFAGVVEAAVSGTVLDETVLHTTVAIDATADSISALYSTTARANVAIRLVGREKIITGAVAGEWDNAPTELSVGNWQTARPLTSGTEKVTTSGTSVDHVSIPSWVKKITISFAGVSTSGTSEPIIQLGHSAGTFTATGYTNTVLGESGAGTTISNFTTGFGLAENPNHLAADTISGQIILALEDSANNTWTCNGALRKPAPRLAWTVGDVSLAATLDAIRLTTVGGSETFDAGAYNILYE